MKKLILETTAPFQGLPELVADKEGLFAKEGLTIEWVERESEDKSPQHHCAHETTFHEPPQRLLLFGTPDIARYGKGSTALGPAWYSKCRCGPIARPVMPTSATCWSRSTRWPADTKMRRQCALSVKAPLAWTMISKFP